MNRLRDLLKLPPDQLEEALMRLPSWKCSGCGETWPERRQVCATCEDRERDEEHAAARAIQQERSFAAVVREAGVPDIFLFTAEPLKPFLWPIPAKPYETLDLSTWNGSRGEPWAVGFLGESNGGKSVMATVLFLRLLREKRVGVWIRASRFVSQLYGREGGAEQQKAARLVDVPVLLLDDLGWAVKGGAMETILEAIAERHAHRRATLWTSNRGLKELVEGVAGEALLRRLREGAVVPVKGSWETRLVQRPEGVR